MAVKHRAYLLGPPVSSAGEINRLAKVLLSRWTGKEIRNFEVISVDGPVLYKSHWVKTTTAAAARRRPSMQGCDLWSLQFSSSDLHLDTGLSLIVQDAYYYRLPHDQRLNSTPEYKTFLFSIPAHGVVKPGAVLLWKIGACTGWGVRTVHAFAIKR